MREHSRRDNPGHAQRLEQVVEGCALVGGLVEDNDVVLGARDGRVEMLWCGGASE